MYVWQLLPLQYCESSQTVEHPPQNASVLLTSVSHPVLWSLSQLRKLPWQLSTSHCPLRQTAVALDSEQSIPNAGPTISPSMTPSQSSSMPLQISVPSPFMFTSGRVSSQSVFANPPSHCASVAASPSLSMSLGRSIIAAAIVVDAIAELRCAGIDLAASIARIIIAVPHAGRQTITTGKPIVVVIFVRAVQSSIAVVIEAVTNLRESRVHGGFTVVAVVRELAVLGRHRAGHHGAALRTPPQNRLPSISR